MSFAGPNNKTYISTGTTTQVTTAGESPSILERIWIQAATTGTVKIYDDDDGTDGIFVDLPTSTPADVYDIDTVCNVGIRVVTSAADKVLVVWRKLAP